MREPPRSDRRHEAQTIGNLQVLRGFAATAVVFYHTGFPINGVHTEFAAVAMFFAISGFVMCLITQKDADQFVAKRVIRIAPLYWLSTIGLLALTARSGLLRFWAWRHDFTVDFFRSVLFVPSAKMPVLGVGWTLNLEMYFYALFAIALLAGRRWAPALTAAAILAVVCAAEFGCSLTVCTVYAHPYVELFVCGMALFYVWRVAGSCMPKWATVAICVPVIVACLASHLVPQMQWLFPWPQEAPTLVVAGALFLASAGADLQWRALILLGDASYAIYLTHLLPMHFLPPLVVNGYMPEPTASAWAAMATMIACVGFGVGVHLLIEKPLLRALRRRFLVRS